MFHSLLTMTRYDIRITLRHPSSWLTPLLFFVIVTSLFPLAVSADTQLIVSIAPGIIWVGALLALLLSIGDLFRTDAHEGYLDLLLSSPYPLTSLVFCKIISHWLTHCLPLVIISPLLGFLLNLPPEEILALVISLLFGTPILCLLGAIGAALMVGVRGSGLLLPILIMPLYIPVLIFGTETVMAAGMHQSFNGYIAVLGALMLISVTFAPLLTAAALRIGVNQ